MGTNFKYAVGSSPNDVPLLGKVISVGSGVSLVRNADGDELLLAILTQLRLANVYSQLAQDEELVEEDLEEVMFDV